jgi:NAD(P)-dependent dehydrogenase (short-subunit alcohol dehydrogenase family)
MNLNDISTVSLTSLFHVSGPALVTGGGGGIGRAVARALAMAGSDVCVLDIDERAAADVAGEIGSGTTRGFSVGGDLEDLESLGDIVARAERRLGTIRILVNNASISLPKELMSANLQEWSRTMAINVTAPWILSQIVARRLIESGLDGRIVNISSSSAYRAVGAGGPYGVSKGAISSMTRVLAGELGQYGIGVNAVAPGLTITGMTSDLFPTEEAIHRAVTSGRYANLLGRESYPLDVAGAVLFLCCPASRQVTGQVLHTSAGAVVGL